MLQPLLLAAGTGFISRLWFLLPLIVVISLVYSASRYETSDRIIRRAGRLALQIAGFMAVDLAWNNAPHISTALPPERFAALAPGTNNETVRLLHARLAHAAAPDRRDRVELIGIDYHWPNLGLAQDFDHVFGHNPLRLRSFLDATHVGDTVAIPPQRMFSPLYPSYRSVFADLLGLRFIATGVPIEQIDSSLKPGDLALVARTSDAYIYENPRALPRVMLLTDWRLADFEELLRSGWPSVDPRRTVLLAKAPSGFSGGGTADVTGSTRLLRYGNSEVTVETDAPGGAILLLNDVWQPWWRAEVDGADAEILKADVIFRAVVVAPGRHIVHFTFHPLAGALAELAGKIRQWMISTNLLFGDYRLLIIGGRNTDDG